MYGFTLLKFTRFCRVNIFLKVSSKYILSRSTRKLNHTSTSVFSTFEQNYGTSNLNRCHLHKYGPLNRLRWKTEGSLTNGRVVIYSSSIFDRFTSSPLTYFYHISILPYDISLYLTFYWMTMLLHLLYSL